MTLELIPNNDLTFKGPFNVVSTTTLKLSNNGTERLAYKIKTTAPKRYCVKPNSGFLDSHSVTSVQVMLQPQPTGPQDDRSKHKFMVQWIEVPSNYGDDVENFWKQDLAGQNIRDSKLKCVFSDEQPAAVVPNDSTGARDSDTTKPTTIVENRPQPINKADPPISSNIDQRLGAHFLRDNNSAPDRSQDVVDDSNKPQLKQELDRLKDENDLLKESLKGHELRQRNTGVGRIDNPVIDRPKPNQYEQKGLVLYGIRLTQQIVLVAFVVALLFGFSLGYFLFSCGN